MSENSWFFTCVGAAPTYGPSDLAQWLYNASFRNDGVLKGLDDSLNVTTDGLGNALIATGCAMKSGYGYQNTGVITMPLALPAVGYQNINTLVVRVDTGASPNLMHAYKLAGVSVANPGPPAAPAIVAGTDVYLCDILIVNTAGSYTYAVTDKRAFAGTPAMLPIGTILAFDGSGWVDNSTMPGWYACIAANAGVGCPNLVDRFLLGKVVAGSGALGGSNTHTIAAAELPAHTHDVVLGAHSHTILFTTGSGSSGPVLAATNGIAAGITPSTSSVDLGTKTSTSVGLGTAIDTHPANYSVIYIRRCA